LFSFVLVLLFVCLPHVSSAKRGHRCCRAWLKTVEH